MLLFLLRRVMVMIPTLLLVSILCFTVITIQPGSFLNRYLEDPRVSPQTVARITADMGLDRPAWQQYLYWIKGIVTEGDFGYSFSGMRPVSTVIGELLGWTVVVAGITMVFAWAVAVPLGIITALKRNGFTDFIASFLGYIGLAVPDFLIALLLVALVLNTGGTQVGGLFSPEYIGQPWTWAKFVDLLGHLRSEERRVGK